MIAAVTWLAYSVLGGLALAVAGSAWWAWEWRRDTRARRRGRAWTPPTWGRDPSDGAL